MNKIFLIIIMIFTASGALPGEDTTLFRKILEESSKIKTVDAAIVQHINTPEFSGEVFKGRYRVNEAGNFRIDYTTPSNQIVLNDGRQLLWYYPDERLLYEVGGDRMASKPKLSPLREYEYSKLLQRYELLYLGEHIYGFFSFAHQFVVKDNRSGNATDIFVDVKKLVVLSKITRDAGGIELVKEIYENYKKINDIFVPTKVSVYARTGAGIVRNTTEYSDIRLNYGIPADIFSMKFPPDVVKKYLK